MGAEYLLGFLIACALGALVGSISYRTYRPRILHEFNNSTKKRSTVPRPPESEKHRLLMELFSRVDQLPHEEISPAAAYMLKGARKGGIIPLYQKAEEVFGELEERIEKNPVPGMTLNGTGLYRIALRIALVGIADDRISDLRSEVLSWGFDELAPIGGAELEMAEKEPQRASGIAVPISLR